MDPLDLLTIETSSPPPPHPITKVPWQISPSLLKRALTTVIIPDKIYARVKVLPSDPEYAFVFDYYNRQKPPGMQIASIWYLYNSDLPRLFEEAIVKMNVEKASPRTEIVIQTEQKKIILERWQSMVEPFSPLQLELNKRICETKKSKLLPLWSSIADENLDTIEITEFATPFRKCSSADRHNFCKPISFTSSPHYASMQAKGKLLLSWVSMLEPYPVVSDTPLNRSSDMIKLKGLKEFKNYNALFIPIAQNYPYLSNSTSYYPCFSDQKPTCDEFVVFQNSQILPQFLVELETNLSKGEPICPFQASFKGDLSLLQKWIEEDPSRIHIQGPNRETLFYFAALGGQIEVMEWLTEKIPQLIYQTTSFGATPLYAAVLGKKMEAIQWIYSRAKFQLFTVISLDWSLLHLSAFLGYEEGVLWLIQQSKELIYMTTIKGWTPFYVAALGGQINVLKLLKNHPDCQDMISVSGEDGSTPLHAAAFQNEVQTISWLCSEMKILMKKTSRNGNGLIHWAVSGSALDVIQWIRENYPTFISATNHQGETALHIAANEGRIEAVMKLHTLWPIKDINGKTALHIAVIYKQSEVVRFLLEKVADPFELTTENENIFHFCAYYGYVELLQEIIGKTQDRKDFKQALHQKDSEGNIPLHKAVWLSPQPAIVQLFLDADVDPDCQNNLGYTPLHLAAKHGHLDSARLLVAGGGKINPTNHKQETPFDLALRWHQDELSLFLAHPDGFREIEEPQASAIDLEVIYSHAFKQAYLDADGYEQVFYLEKLADLYLKRKVFSTTANILNSLLNALIKYQYNSLYQKRVFFKLESLERNFLQENFNIVLPIDNRGYIANHREDLKQIRKETANRLKTDESPIAIQSAMTKKFQEFLINMIEDAMMLLKIPPKDFVVLGLGSIGRHEMSPYSDVEFAFLIKDLNQKNEFIKLAQLLDLKIRNLGETDYKIIPKIILGKETQQAKSFCPDGFSVDSGGLSPLGLPGIYDLIGTPEELAYYQSNEWLEETKESGTILTNAMAFPSRLMGDESLFNRYNEHVKKILDDKQENVKCREKRALKFLEGHIKEFNPNLESHRVGLRAFNVKKDFYRPFQIVLESLSIYHELQNLTTFGRIEELQSKGIICADGAKNLKKAFEIAIGFRLRVQLFYHTECEQMLHIETADDKEYFSIGSKEQELILEIYRILISFHSSASHFVRGERNAFQSSPFYDPTVGQGGLEEEKEFRYGRAEEKFIQAAVFNPNSKTLQELGLIELKLGKTTLAIERYKKALLELKQKYGETPHYDVACCLCNMGNVYDHLGQTKKALQCHKKALAIQKQLFVYQPHLVIAISLNNVGTNYSSLGQMEKAIDYYRQAEEMCKQLGEGQSDFNLIPTIHLNLGNIYQSLGKKQLAEDYYNQSVMASQQHYGDSPHPSHANILLKIMLAYKDLDQMEKALAYGKQSFAMHEQLFGKNHPDVADCLVGLGGIYTHLGQAEQAIECYDQAFEICKCLSNKQIYHAAASTFANLGSKYNDLKQREKALACYQKSVVLFKQYFSKDFTNATFAAVLANLGNDQLKTINKQKALELCKQSVQVFEELFGTNPNPSFAQSLHNLGIAYSTLGQKQEAIDSYLQALAMQTKLFENKPNLDMAKTLHNLAYLCGSMNQIKEAILYYKQSLAIQKEIFKEEPHFDITECLNNLGNAYSALGQHQEAIDYLYQAVIMRKQLCDEKPDQYLARFIYNLGIVYKNIGEIQNSLDYFEESFSIYKQINCEGFDEEIGHLLSQLGFTYLTLHRNQEGAERLKQAIEIQRQVFGNAPQITIIIDLINLAKAHQNLNQLQKAIVYYKQALAMKRQLDSLSFPQSETKNPLSHSLPPFSIPGLTFQKIEGDGNCFFNSVALYLQMNQEDLRKLTADHIESNLETFKDSINLAQGQTLSGYLNDLKNGTGWADHVEIIVIMKLLDRPIYIIGPEGSLRNETDIDELNLTGDPIFVFYNGLNHYDAYLFDNTLSGRDIVALFGNNCPDEAMSQQNLENNKSIIESNLFAKPTKTKIFELPDINSADIYTNLGHIYLSLNQFQKCVTYYKKALLMQRQLFSQQPHPDIVQSLQSLGAIHMTLELWQTAIEYYNEALTMQKKLTGEDPLSSLAVFLQNLGMSYQSLGQFQEAIGYYKQALVMKQQLDDQQPDINRANIYTQLGKIYWLLLEFQQSVSYSEKALVMHTQLLENKPNLIIVSLLAGLGAGYMLLNQFQNAIDHLHNALTMNKLLDVEQPHMDLMIIKLLSEAYTIVGEAQKATEFQEQLLEIEKLFKQEQ